MRVGVSARRMTALLLTCVAVGLPATATPSATPQHAWTRLIASPADEIGLGVAATSSGAFAVGSTSGTIPGQSSAGYFDAFVRRYRASGEIVWTRQFGTEAYDIATAVATNGSAVFVAGPTAGALGSGTAHGAGDNYLRRYDANGDLKWTRQFGTSDSDDVAGVTVAGSRVYVAGATYGTFEGQSAPGAPDAFLRVYDLQGHHLWTHQFGTFGQDFANAVAATSSGVYVVGTTEETLFGQTSSGGPDGFVRRYDTVGNVMWTRQFGTAGTDKAVAASVNSSGLYVAGHTFGSFPRFTNAGLTDAFVRSYSKGGVVGWTRQIGGPNEDEITGLAATAAGVYASGATKTSLYGQGSAGGQDAFVWRYTDNGALVWARQFGTAKGDAASAVTAAGSGVYAGGTTNGMLGGQTGAGGAEAFIRRYVSYRPDALISKSESSGYAGDDVYNDTASNQVQSADVARGDKQAFYVRAWNDGDAADTFAVDGCASSGNFDVTYLRGSDDVTAKVVDGTYRMTDLDPGTAATLRTVVKVAGDAPAGASKVCAVTIRSTKKPALTDTVKAVVEAKS
jgi:hypothetical protein